MLSKRNKRLVSLFLVVSLWISCIYIGIPNTIAYADEGSQTITADGLVGEWKFDEVSTGGITPDTFLRNNAILSGAALGSGKVGKALLLNGYDNYATVPNQNLINTGSDFTISLLLNFNSLYTNRNVVIVQQQGEGGETLLSRRPDGRLQSSLGGTTTIGETLIEPKKWYHVSLSREGDQVKLYVNGALEKVTDDTLLVSNIGEFRIGADREAGVTNAWPGYIDELKIYDKALTDEEMKLVPGFSWPTISLKGNSEMNLSLNDAYVESGATASDSSNIDITGSIQMTGQVDTSKGGIYKIKYTVPNDEGDTVSKVRTVTVLPPKTLSRASRVLIDKGLQMQTWMTTEDTGRKYATADEWKGSNFTTATYYEFPGYNETFHANVPEAGWSYVKGSAGFWGALKGPEEKDKDGFLTEPQMKNLNNLITISFGDEELYSQDMLKIFTDWFKLSHDLYPNVLAHSNQQSRQWQRDDYETYIRTAEPDLLTFDDYLFTTTGSDNNHFTTIVNNINDQRTIALKGYDGTGQSPIAFGQYLLGFKTGVNSGDTGSYIISESQIYGVPFATLTLGGKWLSMFRWEYDSNSFLLFDKDGKPTEQYHQYAEMARQIKNLGPHLVRLNSTDASIVPGQHMDENGKISKNLTPRETPVFDKNTQLKHPYLRSIAAKNTSVVAGDTSGKEKLNGDVLLGFFEPLPDTKDFFKSDDMEYFMVMNGLTLGNGKPAAEQHGKGTETEQTITVQLNLAKYSTEAIKKVSRLTGQLEPVTLKPIGGNVYELEVVLNGGTADLFQLDKTKVNANYIAVDSLSLPATFGMNAGESTDIDAVVSPVNATEKNVEWYSSNSQVATVDSDGKVNALARGKAVITAITVDGNKKATVEITVSSTTVPVTGITVSPSIAKLYTGDTMKLTAVISPDNATNKAYDWFSSDVNVATVDQNGIVIAKAPGSVDITVKTSDGLFQAKSTITVLKAISDASLSALIVNEGRTNISFDSEVLNYTTTIDSKVDTITLRPRLKNNGTIKVNDTSVKSGQLITAEIPMGNSKIVIATTAADGSTTKNYTLTVKRNKNVALEATVARATYLDHGHDYSSNDYDNTSDHSPLKYIDGNVETYFQSAAITALNPKGEFSPSHRIMLQWDDNNVQDFNKLVLVVNNAQQQGLTVMDTQTTVDGINWEELNKSAYKPTWQTDSPDIYERITIDLPNYKEYYGKDGKEYKGLKGIYLLLWAANLNADRKYAINEFELYNEQDATEPVKLTVSGEPEHPDDSLVADWVFSEENVQSGTSIAAGNLVIKDRSGHNNDLIMAEAKNPIDKRLSFTADGALDFTNAKDEGHYLTTVNDAPINTETFKNGFTIEAEFKLGSSINNWMGILTRRGNNTFAPGEQEPLSTLSISSIREVQWASTQGNSSSNEIQSNWSNSLSYIKAWAKSDDYTHVAVVNDGSKTRLFLNGVESIRNPLTDEIINGIMAEEGMGWNVGAYEWDRAPDSLFLGKIRHIRVTSKALEKDQFFKTEFNYKVDYGTNDDLPMFAPDTYTFAIIPDPQYVVQSKPEILEKQLQFLADNYQSKNIAMTVNVGDTTQSSAAKEWASADKAFKILDNAKVPYIVTRGNHDTNGTGYIDTMGPKRFAETEHFKGASPSGLSTYSIINAGSYKYMFLAVDSVGNNSSNTTERNWAKTVLNENPKIPTVIFSHNIMTIDGNGQVSEGGQGSLFWSNLVEKYDQVFMMVGGHISGAGLNVKKNYNGKEVLQVLTDYQSDIAGGNGWTSFFEFDEKSKEIHVKTFSPYVDSIPVGERSYLDTKFLIGPGDMYDIPFDFSSRFGFAKKDIIDVSNPTTISVSNGTPFNSIGLPSTVKVKLVDEKEQDVSVTWQQGDYNAAIPGAYTVIGMLNLTDDISNTTNKTAKIIVTVAASGAVIPDMTNGSGSIKLNVPSVDAGTGEGKAVLAERDWNKALSTSVADHNGVKTVKVEVPKADKAKAYVVELPKASLNSDQAIHMIEVTTEFGTITVPANMLNGQDLSGAKTVALVIANVDQTSLDPALQQQIGERPVIEVDVYIDGAKVAWNNPQARVKISVPYQASDAELADPEHIVVGYIDISGKATIVSNGKYISAAGMVTFTTTHFSKYAVMFVHKTFNDLENVKWAKKQIEVLASKGVVNGTSVTKYNPSASITRADFIVLLMKTLELTAPIETGFSDVNLSAYYYNEVTMAKKLGITKGSGDNKFNPLQQITRQDAFELLHNAMKVAGKNLNDGTSADLDRFIDKTEVANYAAKSLAVMVKNGIVQGNGNSILPLAPLTRAESAVILYNVINK
ncbi:LamG-like jellyroll fold domain-containing protein [Paenibacillus sp. PL91]|uniref:LamG-like jellyroll fold domain-containing protein n=1 Tax=Paenibacillus sp. PL91 TaxID=2729538 RepID=UPI00145E2AE3|nr:LamG-like jellyroll fold domain-containing protein [Paenibacillus sp. PL91]MBC9199298.1 S-layer homology domain-containing protein [Paenibacillus sp. PL91]